MKFHVYYHLKLKEKGLEYTKMTDDQLVNQFPCYYDNCDQIFADYRGFKAHENKFHNEFIFKCRDPSCEYRSSYKLSLRIFIEKNIVERKTIV